MTRIIVTIVTGLVIGGLTLTCSQTTNGRLQAAVETLSKSAEECLYDVRDRHETWETSQHCAALGAVASTYIDAGGFQEEPAEIRVIAEKARVTAWKALATSLAGGKPLSIW